MPVIALHTQDLHRDLTHRPIPYPTPPSSSPDEPDSPKAMSTAPARMNGALPPTPTSPMARAKSASAQGEIISLDPEDEAGPSHQRQSSIPPPAHARRHRSGVLMTQARGRANSGGFRGNVVGSKSFGDLSSGLQMSSEVDEPAFRRITSEGSRRDSDDDNLWDNSARFYHHLHTSRPASRQTSPDRTTPRELSPSRTISSSASPIHIRRSQTLPQNGPLPSVVSPAHAFLQSHLPPLFPSPGSSPEHPGNHMVILTPTTAEWKELKREMGEPLDRIDSSGSSGSESSIDVKHGLMLDPGRPSIKTTVSADYIQMEKTHTADPGDPTLLTPIRPVFQQNLIAPSPISDHAITLDDAGIADAADDSPQRFASIGRRSSLHIVPKMQVQEPKKKTKRELERERLFRDLDEELEADKGSATPFEAVQQIGSGLRLSESGRIVPIPLESPSVVSIGEAQSVGQLQLDLSPTSPTKKSTGSGSSLGSASSVSPSMPFRPSPLHGSPLLARTDLSPEESPESSPALPPHMVHTANLETIRDYARSLADAKEPTLEISNPLEAKSPRLTHRRRDTKRVSLVAGRIVQPFTVPPDTALPPDHHRANSSLAKKASLNSFSPFHTPAITPSNSTSGLTPHKAYPFTRMDSAVSVAPSIAPPSEPGTPTSETAGGVGGRGIDDYVIISEAGKGAYGLVMRARVKGPNGEAEGEEVIIKYIVKVRILADCWKKHKVLGPIPVEIHVMDQLRHLMYNTPKEPNPWDPTRQRPGDLSAGKRPLLSALQKTAPVSPPPTASPDSAKSSPRSFSYNMYSNAQRYIASELRVSPDRGHPNICKLLDFFEDREFYYMVMPRFGSGLDLFDRVEASPTGLPAFDVRSLVGQLADAVRFLHANGIVHRDIKDENVILDGQGRCQLIDFGSSAHWRPGRRWDTFSGTLHYASPEILRGDYYGGKEQDIYALGTVMYVLLVGETPFAELPDEVLIGLKEGSRGLEALQERCLDLDKNAEEDGGGKLKDAEDLVRRCLELEVGDRPTAEMVCSHRFLKGGDGWTGYKGWVKK